jgi:hypothetical protein
MKYMVVLWFHLTIVYQKKIFGSAPSENYYSRILLPPLTLLDMFDYLSYLKYYIYIIYLITKNEI